jgi:TonB family protein
VIPVLSRLEYEFEYWGDQKGRWRVWAVDAQSQPGFKSPWSSFEFIPGLTAAPAPVPTAEPAGPDRVYFPGNGVVPGRVVYRPEPEYTEAARKAKISGTVVLDVVIGPDGAVRDAQVVKSLEPGLDANAIIAMKKWRFEPAMKDGHPVAIRVQISTSFRLL